MSSSRAIGLKSNGLHVTWKYQIKELRFIRYVEISDQRAAFYTLHGNIRIKSRGLYVTRKYQIKEQRFIRYVEISE